MAFDLILFGRKFITNLKKDFPLKFPFSRFQNPTNRQFWYPFFRHISAVSLSQNVSAAATASVSPASVFSGGASPSTLSALVSQHRLLELSRFGLRGYDLAQHMLTQQGAVSKLLGKLKHTN